MDSTVIARVKTLLNQGLHYDPYQCNAIMNKVASLARMAGFGLDRRFSAAGLGAGPEARVASRLITYAMVGSHGTETTEYEIRRAVEQWLLKNPGASTQR